MAVYGTFSNEDLVVLLKDGDHLAYSEIYKRFHTLLYAYAYKKLNDRETAKDLIQEIFLSLWNRREALSITGGLAGYLYRAVRNRAFDIFAHQKVERQYVDSLQNFLDTDTSTADYLLREKDIQALIDREIELMPKGMREVFVLSRKHYLTHKEIAQQLDMSEEAVNKQIKRALKTLRVKLGLVTYLMICYQFMAVSQKKKLDEKATFFSIKRTQVEVALIH